MKRLSYYLFWTSIMLLGSSIAISVPSPSPTGSPEVWYFPGASISYWLRIKAFTLPTTFTIAMWIKPMEYSTAKYLLTFSASSNTDCMRIGSRTPVVDEWQFIVLTFDGEDTTTYIDGTVTTALVVGAYCNNQEPVDVYFGQEQDTYGGTGSLDATNAPEFELNSVAIYSEAWSAATVSDIGKNLTCFNETCSCNTLYALWISSDSFSAVDLSGNGYDAEVVSVFTDDIATNVTSQCETEVFSYCSTVCESSSWYFPGASLSYWLRIKALTVPTVFTIAMWVKPRQYSTSGALLSFSTSSNDNCLMIGSKTPVLDEWQFIVVTFDGDNTLAYIDGTLTTALVVTAYCDNHQPVDVYFGQEQDSYGGTGNLDASQAPEFELNSVAIYIEAWSEATISDIGKNLTCFNETCSCSTLYALWISSDSFSAVDLSGNGYDAEVVSVFIDDIAVNVTSQCEAEDVVPCSSACESTTWYFPGASTSYYMIAEPFTFPGPSFTIAAWIKPYESTTAKNWMSYEGSSTSTNCMLLIASFPETDKWQFVVHTYDATTDVATSYVDGSEHSAMTDSTYYFCGKYTGALVIGQEQDSYGGTFQAVQAPNFELSSFAVYNGSWSAATVAAIGNSIQCFSPYENSLTTLWISGNTTDLTGNADDILDYTLPTTNKGIVSKDCIPSPSPTSLPTLVPSLVPTSVPSPIPIPSPSPLPTSLPAPLPTNLPTLLPTAAPTLSPSPLPTSLPTPLPTHLPTPLPTSFPTPAPTASPSTLPTIVPTSTPSTFSPTSVVSQYIQFQFQLKITSEQGSNYVPSIADRTALLSLTESILGKNVKKFKVFSLSPTSLPSPMPTASPSVTPCPTATLSPTSPILRQRSRSLLTSGTTTWGVSFDLESTLNSDIIISNTTGALSSSSFSESVATALNATAIVTDNVVSIVSTRNPSSLPTQSPTTWEPSSLPTAAPTPVPTLYCGQGYYLFGLACLQCDIGKYSTVDEPPFATSCDLCPAGQYNSQFGQYECTSCAGGKLSSEDRSYCGDCSAGEYAFNDTSCVGCEQGRYAPQALSDECLECGAGSFTNNLTKATTCTSCQAGTYSNASSASCVSCDKGYYSSSGSASCAKCGKGLVSPSQGSSSCTACDAGHYAPSKGLWNCTSCPIGKSQGSTSASSCITCISGYISSDIGATSCSACSAGSFASSSVNCTACPVGRYQGSAGLSECFDCDESKFASSVGSTTCTNCETGYSSTSGSQHCELADDGYFLSFPNYSAIECPDNALCKGDEHLPIPLSGYWVDRDLHAYAKDIYRCSRSACKGGRSSNLTCWQINNFYQEVTDDSECDSNTILCEEGTEGPLCGACSLGYVYRGSINSCARCEDAEIETSIMLGTAIIALMIFAFIWYRRESLDLSNFYVLQFLFHVDSGGLKVLWVTYQIIVSSSFTLDVQYPPPFSFTLSFMSVFSLDFLSLECSRDSHSVNTYFLKVYTWCALPIIIALVIIVVGVVRWILQRSSDEIFKRENSDVVNNIINQHVWSLLFLSYIVLPPVANQQFQSLDCITLESDLSYLRADTSIDCDSEEYATFSSIIYLFIVFYQMIPVLWMMLLYRKQHLLNPSASKNDEKLAEFIRSHNQELTSLKFLFSDYKCTMWWFEILDMYRRIVFIGILPLVSPQPTVRASLGCILAIIGSVYIRETQPYRIEFTNVISHFAQFAIMVTYYAAMTIEGDSMTTFGLEGQNLGIFLVCFNSLILIFVFSYGWSIHKQKRREKSQIEWMATNYEDARGFSANKFNTTFEAVWSSSIPTSHALVFHYTTFAQAKMDRKSGIPSQTRFDGVPLTLRYPHHATENDFEVFQILRVNNSNHLKTSVSPRPSKKDSGMHIVKIDKQVTPSHQKSDVEATTLSISKDQDAQGKSVANLSKMEKKPSFPNEFFFAISLPRHFLEPLKGYEDDNGLCMISKNVLGALRPTEFTDVTDGKPWINRMTLLSPKCILRSFLVSNTDTTKSNSVVLPHRDRSVSSIDFVDFNFDDPVSRSLSIEPILALDRFGIRMASIRGEASKLDLVPLYHYTSPTVGPMIMSGGMRMSTQGQGDGGVYVSTQGPASYGLGSKNYEVNIIKDCFGVERLDEYMGKGILDVIIVYGCTAAVLEQCPGGRANAKMVSKSTFTCLSLKHANENYFLRPDRILGVFQVDHSVEFKMTPDLDEMLKKEKNCDQESVKCLRVSENHNLSNTIRIEEALARLKPKSSVSLPDNINLPTRRLSRLFVGGQSGKESIKTDVKVLCELPDELEQDGKHIEDSNIGVVGHVIGGELSSSLNIEFDAETGGTAI